MFLTLYFCIVMSYKPFPPRAAHAGPLLLDAVRSGLAVLPASRRQGRTAAQPRCRRLPARWAAAAVGGASGRQRSWLWACAGCRWDEEPRVSDEESAPASWAPCWRRRAALGHAVSEKLDPRWVLVLIPCTFHTRENGRRWNLWGKSNFPFLLNGFSLILTWFYHVPVEGLRVYTVC